MITTPRRTLRGEKGGNKHSIKALNCNDDDDGEAIKNSKVRGWPQYLHGFKIRKKAKKVNSYQGFVARMSKFALQQANILRKKTSITKVLN